MFNYSTRACQLLVNAQISVNRAVFAMNKQGDKDFDNDGGDVSDKYIKREIKNAIKELSKAIGKEE